MIYELIHSEEFKNDNIKVICSQNRVDEFLIELYDNDIENLICKDYVDEIVDDEEFLVISRTHTKTGVNYDIEPLFYKGKQFAFEADCIFVEDNLLDVVDFDRLHGEVITLNSFEEEEIDILDELADELLEEIEDLEQDCVHCLIKNKLEVAYAQGVHDLLDILME